MKKFSIIHIPFLSFFSKDLYIDVGLNWKRVCFGYLLLILAICWIPAMIRIHLSFSHFVSEEAPLVVNQVPEIKIQDGEVSVDVPQPYYIKDADNDEVLAIIDTTGSITSLKDTDALCLLTKDTLVYKKNEFQSQKYDLQQVQHFVLDSDRITGWLKTSRKFLAIMIYPFALLGSYIARIVQALIYAAAGLFFASLCNVKLKYDALLRLAVVAVTPSMIIKTVFGVAGIHLSFVPLIFIAITLGYLYFGVKAVSQVSEEVVDFQDPESTLLQNDPDSWK
jgi:hypothetical protein